MNHNPFSRHKPLLLTAAWLLSAMPALAQTGSRLSWNLQQGNPIVDWIRTLGAIIMAIFVIASIIIASLAFKQLASDNNWKDFWTKITGAIGMFAVPLIIYWVVDNIPRS